MSTALAPLPESSTAHLVADRIREAIWQGTLRPGDRLVETDLAERFEISRGPVREAIRLLAPEGLIVLRRNRGAVVANPTFDDVLEVYAARMTLGELALATIARRGVDRATFDEVTSLLDRLRDPIVQADPVSMLEADLAFQDALMRLSDLPRIADMLENSGRDAASFVRLLGITYESTDHDALIARHERTLAAIAATNPAEAVTAWQDHIRLTVAEFARGYREVDDLSVDQHPLFAYPLSASRQEKS
ncbi:MAG: GntR family transcriptional regulator [Candidatus Nanopelagicales bacterium]|jgi:DNA-binding GntR family transcriptional regulator